MNLAEFLLQRIGEDEADAREDRVLAECARKRWLVGYWTEMLTSMREGFAADLTLRLLALPYAGHPDYREEWRP